MNPSHIGLKTHIKKQHFLMFAMCCKWYKSSYDFCSGQGQGGGGAEGPGVDTNLLLFATKNQCFPDFFGDSEIWRHTFYHPTCPEGVRSAFSGPCTFHRQSFCRMPLGLPREGRVQVPERNGPLGFWNM